MVRGALSSQVIIYSRRQILYDQTQIPLRYIRALHAQVYQPVNYVFLCACSEQPRMLCAVHRRHCFPY